MVSLVKPHALLVPLAAGVLEIVLKYVLSKTVIMSLGVRQDLRMYLNQLIQEKKPFINKFAVYVFIFIQNLNLFTVTVVNSYNCLQLQEYDMVSLEHQVNQI